MWKSSSVIKLKNRSLVFGLRKKIKWKSGEKSHSVGLGGFCLFCFFQTKKRVVLNFSRIMRDIRSSGSVTQVQVRAEQDRASIFGDVKVLGSFSQVSLEGLILKCFKGHNTGSKSSNPHAAFS